MPRSIGSPEPTGNLRLKAEARASAQPTEAATASLSPETALRLLHELQVHQIELEMQNDELRRTQLELQQSKDRYFDLYELAPAGYLTLTGAGVITESNLRAATLIGASRESLIGSSITRFILPDDQDRYYHHRRQLRMGGVQQTIDVRMRPEPEGRTIWLSVSSALALDSITGAVVCRIVLDDITGMKQAQAEAEHQTAEISRQSAELRAERDRAEAATRAKDQFLSSISHEIRTPLNGIIGMIELLLATTQTTEQRCYANTVRDSSDALLVIINDILDFAKMTAGKLTLAPIQFHLPDTLQGVVDLLAAQAREKGLELLLWCAPNTPGEVIGDPGRLRQMVLNLVSNAIKFTERGQVLIEAGLQPDPGDGSAPLIRIAIHDTGIGIPEDGRDRIFRRFEQLEGSPMRRCGGTGLGLAIVKELVQLMGGQITVTSAPGEGSCFSLSLPLPVVPDAGRTSPETAAAAASSALEGVRLLIADCEPLSRLVLGDLCRGWGLRVEEAESGPEALRLAEAANSAGDPFRIVCWDDRLLLPPGLAGKGPGGAPAVVLLRSLDANRPAVADSAGGGWSESDCNAWLRKPVRPIALQETLRRVIAGFELPQRSGGLAFLVTPPSASILEPAPRFTHRILLVEDHPVNRKVAESLLTKLGCSVESAVNGEVGCRMAAVKPYDLILMDCHMPVMDGFAATAEIRRRERDEGTHTPVVGFTASVSEKDHQDCLDHGMDDFVAKPVNMQRFIELLKRWKPCPA